MSVFTFVPVSCLLGLPAPLVRLDLVSFFFYFFKLPDTQWRIHKCVMNGVYWTSLICVCCWSYEIGQIAVCGSLPLFLLTLSSLYPLPPCPLLAVRPMNETSEGSPFLRRKRVRPFWFVIYEQVRTEKSRVSQESSGRIVDVLYIFYYS